MSSDNALASWLKLNAGFHPDEIPALLSTLAEVESITDLVTLRRGLSKGGSVVRYAMANHRFLDTLSVALDCQRCDSLIRFVPK